MAHETTIPDDFWNRVDLIREHVFSSEELDLLEEIKSAERDEERLARA